MITIIIGFLGVSVVAAGIAIALCFWTGNVYDEFKKNGIKTLAKVIDIRELSTSGSIKCEFLLEFQTVSGEIKRIKKTKYVSMLVLARIDRDKQVEIYYKPNNFKKIWIITGNEEKQSSR
ncbi:hypothetical protein PMPD1_0838 [Paramixta manurensis]|uniref:DUF3592 domain-containing protein n=1 Tax=Paramixta manurensis TaxID=2740817 RepID=A0A6M8U837_9GAMM|nr:hypothetical protein PMPD1_0838 [Erwiniaceae bacterium PD-1]